MKREEYQERDPKERSKLEVIDKRKGYYPNEKMSTFRSQRKDVKKIRCKSLMSLDTSLLNEPFEIVKTPYY